VRKAEQWTFTLRPFGVCCWLLQEEMKEDWASALAKATEVFLYCFLMERSL
jgi:hypothetical protein